LSTNNKQQQQMSIISVKVKWDQQTFDVPLDLSESPSVFKTQIFSLTGVPPERQKIMGVKGGTLKDDGEWTKLGVKQGHIFKLVGTSDDVKKPEEKTTNEDDQKMEIDSPMTKQPVGLYNLENTCYMNSTLQCLLSVPELKSSLAQFTSSNSQDMESNLILSLREVSNNLSRSSGTVLPLGFVNLFRNLFPQFNERKEGKYMQQDAEECWTQLVTCLKKKISDAPASSPAITTTTSDPSSAPTSASTPDVSSKSLVAKLFSGEVVETWKNVESEEEPVLQKKDTFMKLVCHISNNTSHLIDGLKQGLTETISKYSEVLGREANYQKTTKLSHLPPYLTVQFMRFFWKADKQLKAKILRPVHYTLTLDVLELCDEPLKEKLSIKRRELLTLQENQTAVAPPPSDDLVNETGLYDLQAVLTHQGRTSDSGHYVAWVRQSFTEDKWLRFDDETVSPCNAEDIKKLAGGADWHIAYICLYRSKHTL